MFGKCFLHRPIYSKTAVNVLPNRVLLKCSNCDTEHSVGQPCPAVWSGHFNLKDLGTALGNGARNCTAERDWGFLILTSQVQSGVFYTVFTNIALALFLLALSLQFSWNCQALLLTSGQITRSPEYSCVQFAVLVLETAGEHCLIPCLYCALAADSDF